MKKQPNVLIVDDETFVRESLAEVLKHEGYGVFSAAGVDEGVRILGAETVHVVISDLRMPKKDGLVLLREAKRAGIPIPIVMITGVGTLAEAVTAMKEGAYDFLQKPVDPRVLARVVERAAEHHGLLVEARRARNVLAELDATRQLVGASSALERARGMIAQVAATDATVLLSGESGTGKELAAWLVHRKSARGEGPFVLVNCAAFVPGEFELELFGCKKGAQGAAEERVGRIASAEGGTLVLDQVGALEAKLQARLLRFLETMELQPAGEATARRADVRVIAITNEDLGAAVKAGTFRADLFNRLNVFPVPMPRLAELKADLPAIVNHLLMRAAQKRPFGGVSLKVTADALEVLARYDWPGNVRELENVLERAQILAQGRDLDAGLFESLLELPLSVPKGAPGPAEFQLRKNLDALEKELVQRALVHTHNKKKEAAILLGIDPRNLGYYLRKHKLSEG
ncbi:MAG: sigma-54-dependent Fis family transcriptional regulator [Planctomycetes bacterium]|nr:sigma-54-dependent Fis family transcriptional regulator [Planctomycetota bacterium]